MLKTTFALLAAAGLASTLGAGDLEFSLGYGLAFPGSRNLYLDTQGTGEVGTFVQTRFQGPWTEPALEAAYEVYRTRGYRTWVRAGYATALSGLDYAKVGQSITSASLQSETFNGTVKDSQLLLGVGVTYDTGKLGEYGAALFFRSNRIAASGTLTTAADINSNFSNTPSGSSQSATVSDLDLRLSMGLVQTYPTCKVFQRISLDWGFGGSSGNVGAADWQLNKAYLQRLKPSSGYQFAVGIRL